MSRTIYQNLVTARIRYLPIAVYIYLQWAKNEEVKLVKAGEASAKY